MPITNQSCIGFAIVVLLSPALCAQSGKRRASGANPLAGDSGALKSGKELFAGACSACHGVNGEGGHGPSLTESREVRRETDPALFHSIRSGVPGTDMPPSNFPEQEIWSLVTFVRSLSAPAIESHGPGDAAAGRGIFFGKGGCAACHMIRGEGGFPGPDLSGIGAERTLAQLRQSLLEPNARPRSDFRAVTAITRDGRKIEGVARSSTNYSLDILDARGELHLLSTKDLEKVVFQDHSLMPGDYSRRLSAREIDDLLAFLSHQSMSRRNTE